MVGDEVVFVVYVFLVCYVAVLRFFFFQAEDGIRDDLVTGVQTCALPICPFLLAAAPPLFILTISRCGSAPAFILTRSTMNFLLP